MKEKMQDLTTTKQYLPPLEYRFNQVHREKYKSWFWRCPIDVVKEGWWSDLWQGSGAATSILPYLALHAFPQGEDKWTQRAPGHGYRRIAHVTGINKDTVGKGMKVLRDIGLLRTFPVPTESGGRGYAYQLNAEVLYPSQGQRYVPVPGRLFYGGHWALLPTQSARHLYIVLAGLQPVADELAYAEYLLDQVGELAGDEELVGERIGDVRKSQSYRLTDLVDLSGLASSTLREALRTLTETINEGGTSYIRQVRSGRGRRSWYEADERCPKLDLPLDALNHASRLATLRAQIWKTDQAERRAA